MIIFNIDLTFDKILIQTRKRQFFRLSIEKFIVDEIDVFYKLQKIFSNFNFLVHFNFDRKLYINFNIFKH